MPKRITIAEHLSLEELEQRYRQANAGVERSHYQIIWLLKSGKRTEEVAELTGYSRSWIYELVWGYNRIGPSSLGDKRQDNRGQQPLLNDVQQSYLWQALQEPPPGGGLWSGPKVAEWMSQLLGRPVGVQRGWEYLRALEFRRRKPRPLHSEADLIEQEQWKKNWRRP